MQKLKCWMSTVMSVSLVATTLFFIILLYTSSIRPSYIHLLFNLLILAVCADSGILKVFISSTYDTSDTDDDTLVVQLQTNVVEDLVCLCSIEVITDHNNGDDDESIKMVVMEDTEPPLSTSTEDDVEEMTEMELFARAEDFIEKFYKQLKMQRDEQCNNSL